jgi:hypothetical protein
VTKLVTRYPQRWFCEECSEVHPAPHLTSKRLCGYRSCINEIHPSRTVCCDLHGLLLARERGRSIQVNSYQSPLVPTGDWFFAERQRLRKARPELAQILRPIADNAASSNNLYYIEVGNLNVPPGWLPALASLGFSANPDALEDSTLSAGWLMQAVDEVAERRACHAWILSEAWFGLSARGLRRWAHERRLLPQCFLPALYFYRLAQPELQQ